MSDVRDCEADLLGDALDLDPTTLTVISREPLGRGVVAGYRIPAESEAIAYVDTSLLDVAAETGLALEGVARVWMHPADPHLPALVPAAFGHAAQELLARIGIAATGSPEMIAYRPGRRAVLRVAGPAGDHAWVKVVRPSRVERIVEVHAALRTAGLPVPAVRGWSPEGLLVLDGAEGIAATDAPWHPLALLDQIDELRERLAVAELPGRARTSLLSRRDWYAERLVRALPEHADDIVSIAASIGDDAPDAARVVIHGDLHLGQLFLEAGTGRISGLIDVDTAGRGDPVDDLAAFLGHIVASATLTAHLRDAGHVWALADAAWERWGHESRAGALSAVHLLGHALAATQLGDGDRAFGLLAVARTLLVDVDQPKVPLIGAFEAAYDRRAR
ncbi:aminoglycoside phosphotransferase (APT) family kinase protein [Microbacterium marinum]|uniref:Aminoglycoside phosphotransferase (APT) family kinase protein n=1 Tax=Microbacterium marinum TaxID=421115 RepID=A0A7W7BSL7_9MICO|nr:aminoglycoside phosphotransferase (APT) family kinase protein [Microbacterium marinum]